MKRNVKIKNYLNPKLHINVLLNLHAQSTGSHRFTLDLNSARVLDSSISFGRIS